MLGSIVMTLLNGIKNLNFPDQPYGETSSSCSPISFAENCEIGGLPWCTVPIPNIATNFFRLHDPERRSLANTVMMSAKCQKNLVWRLFPLFILCVFYLLYTTIQTGFWTENTIKSQENSCINMCMDRLLKNKTDEVSLCGEVASSRGQQQR